MKSERGAILLHSVVFIFLMGLAISLWMKLSFGRYVMGGKSLETDRGLNELTAVESLVRACFERTHVGLSSCGPAAAGCLPREYSGRKIRVRISGSPPACKLSIRLSD